MLSSPTMEYETIMVGEDAHHYPVYIGCNFLSNTSLLHHHLANKSVCIIAPQRLQELYLHMLEQILQPICKRVMVFVLSDSEAEKNWQTVEQITEFLIEQSYFRDSILVALGGGVLLDVVGFTASIYMRGIPWLAFPTTLLAQVDAAVGGKTAINFSGVKNLLGSFYPPLAIFSDIQFLHSLPQQEFNAAISEIAKYGAVLDAHFFDWLEQHSNLIKQRVNTTLQYLVKHSTDLKAQIVTKDFKEQNLRQLLNFGHTLGHAIESSLGYAIRHGEAVSIGITMALLLSMHYGLSENIYKRVVRLFEQFGLPTRIPPSLSTEILLAALQRDKKNKDGIQTWVIIRALGQGEVIHNVPQTLIRTSMNKLIPKTS